MPRILVPILAGAVAVVLVSAASGSMPKSGEHMVSGTIQAYDGRSRALTLKAAKGEMRFVLAADAQVWDGARSVTPDELAGVGGRKATVAYSANGDEKTARLVRVVPVSTKPVR